ncbi:MAG TPA: hypothetical protein VH589_14630 [Trebonia sp.]
MRYRLMASYLGASYHAAVGPSDRDVTLFAAPPPPEEHGFSPAPGGVWRKQVRLSDLDGLWESRPIGSYHGEPCLVLDDLGDRVHIVYLGMDERRAGQLGYWQVDRGVFEVVVPRADVTDLAEERHEFPIALLLSALPRALSAGDGGRPASGAPSGPLAGNGQHAGNGQLAGNGQHAGSGHGPGNGQHAGNGQPLGTYQLPVAAPQLPPSQQLPPPQQLPPSPQLPVSPQLPPSPSHQLSAAQPGGAQQQQGQTQPQPTVPPYPGNTPPSSAAEWHGSPGTDADPWYHPAGNGTIGQNGAQSYGAANGNGAGLPNGYGNGSQNGFGQPPGGFPQPPVNGLADAAATYSPGLPSRALPAPPQSGHAFEAAQQGPATPPGQQGGQAGQAGRGQQPEAQPFPAAQPYSPAQVGQYAGPAQSAQAAAQPIMAQPAEQGQHAQQPPAPQPPAPQVQLAAAPPAPPPVAAPPSPSRVPPAHTPSARPLPWADALPAAGQLPERTAPSAGTLLPDAGQVAPAGLAQSPNAAAPDPASAPSAVRGRRAARKPRLAMSAVFADLVDMADIPRSAYAVDEEVTGAMCLFKTDGGYEVFSCAEDARHEVRFFEDEEAAYFYLFGVLTADALRNGRLNPRHG